MTQDQAKALLQSYRPHMDSSADPLLAEAIALLETDSDLKAWFERQQAFDQAMAGHLQAVPVPRELKGKILADAHRRSSWLFWNLRPSWAYAAAVCATICLAAFFWWSTPTLGEFCKGVTERSWNQAPHLEFVGDDLARIRLWLRDRKAPDDFQVPASLRQARVRGCNIVHWHGHKVPVLCLLEESKHMHLIVGDDISLADGPGENQPELMDVGQIRTAVWKHKDKTYVLNSLERKRFVEHFVKRFRHRGQWQLTS